MTTLARSFFRLPRRTAFLRDRSGVSAIEFALIAPIMIVMYLGAVEISQALTIDRRVTTLASSTADLVAQVEDISDAEVEDVFKAATSILGSYSNTPLSIVVTSVVADKDNKTEVCWSKAKNGTPESEGASYELPAGLTQAYSGIIVAEVSYTYMPPVGQHVTGGISMTDKFYLRPRRSLTVTLNGEDCDTGS